MVIDEIINSIDNTALETTCCHRFSIKLSTGRKSDYVMLNMDVFWTFSIMLGMVQCHTKWWFQIILIFTPAKDFQFD